MQNIKPLSTSVSVAGNSSSSRPYCNRTRLDSVRTAVLQAAELIELNSRRISDWAPAILADLSGPRRTSKRTQDKLDKDAKSFLKVLTETCGTWNAVTQAAVVRCYTLPWSDHDGNHHSVSPSTVRNRRWIAGVVLERARSLGVDIDPAALLGPPLGGTPATKSSRPLTEDELDDIENVSDVGLDGSMRSVIVALAEAGASAPEIAAVTPEDIDLDAGTVRLRGPADRINTLPGWSRETIALHLATRLDPPTPGAPLCVNADLPPERAEHSITNRLHQVIVDAGHAHTDGVTATSISLTTAKQILETDGLIAATDFLGKASLDRTAASLGVAPQRRKRGGSDG